MLLPVAVICVSISGCYVPAQDMRTTPVSKPGTANHKKKRAPQAPKLRKLKNGRYMVQRRWVVDLRGQRYVIQRGYTSNGITGPNKVKATLGDGVNHPETWAAMFHDWLFTQPGMSRSKADKLFYDLLLAYGVDHGKAQLMYTTVKAYSLSKKFN